MSMMWKALGMRVITAVLLLGGIAVIITGCHTTLHHPTEVGGYGVLIGGVVAVLTSFWTAGKMQEMEAEAAEAASQQG